MNGNHGTRGTSRSPKVQMRNRWSPFILSSGPAMGAAEGVARGFLANLQRIERGHRFPCQARGSIIGALTTSLASWAKSANTARHASSSLQPWNCLSFRDCGIWTNNIRGGGQRPNVRASVGHIYIRLSTDMNRWYMAGKGLREVECYRARSQPRHCPWAVRSPGSAVTCGRGLVNSVNGL